MENWFSNFDRLSVQWFGTTKMRSNHTHTIINIHWINTWQHRLSLYMSQISVTTAYQLYHMQFHLQITFIDLYTFLKFNDFMTISFTQIVFMYLINIYRFNLIVLKYIDVLYVLTIELRSWTGMGCPMLISNMTIHFLWASKIII